MEFECVFVKIVMFGMEIFVDFGKLISSFFLERVEYKKYKFEIDAIRIEKLKFACFYPWRKRKKIFLRKSTKIAISNITILIKKQPNSMILYPFVSTFQLKNRTNKWRLVRPISFFWKKHMPKIFLEKVCSPRSLPHCPL